MLGAVYNERTLSNIASMSDTRARMEPYYPYGFSFLSKLGKRHHTGGGGHKGDILKQVASVGKREVEARDLEYLTTGKMIALP